MLGSLLIESLVLRLALTSAPPVLDIIDYRAVIPHLSAIAMCMLESAAPSLLPLKCSVFAFTYTAISGS